jgi:nucleoside-diphosphate-sugar epimerase
MRLLVTGSSGVLGRVLLPRLAARGDEVLAPGRHELDLFDAHAVRAVASTVDAIVHLATRIPQPEQMHDRAAWAENDRLRAEASRLLVDAALHGDTEVYVQPSVAFLYPPGPADEDTPLASAPDELRSVIDAEQQAHRFTRAGRRGIVLRLGLLHGPTTGAAEPDGRFGASLAIEDAGEALVLALGAPAGTYNVVDAGCRVSSRLFEETTGWRPGLPGDPHAA